MNTETLKPALTADEWQTKSFRREAGSTYQADHISLSPNGDALRIASEVDSELVTVPGADRHALAALALYEQPFGFSNQDVEDEREVAEYCEAMARQIAESGDEATSLTFRSLAERHRARASKIAALLP